MAIVEMKIPFVNQPVKTSEISMWLVKSGDYVIKDQHIAEIDYDKVSLELNAEQNGIITLKAKAGEKIQMGQVICEIDTDAARP